MALFASGDFTLVSGAWSPFKIDCDALTEEDWLTLGRLVLKTVRPFREVLGVPTGGLKLAAALRPFVAASGPILLVDDVLTTGGSINRMRAEIMRERGASVNDVAGAVVFARGPVPYWVRPLFRMPPEFWTPGAAGTSVAPSNP